MRSIPSLGIGRKTLIYREAIELRNLFPLRYAASGNDHRSSPFFGSKRQVNNYIPEKESNNLHLFSGAAVSLEQSSPRHRKETHENTKEDKPDPPWMSGVKMAAWAMIQGSQEQALQVTTFSIQMHWLIIEPTEKHESCCFCAPRIRDI